MRNSTATSIADGPSAVPERLVRPLIAASASNGSFPAENSWAKQARHQNRGSPRIRDPRTGWSGSASRAARPPEPRGDDGPVDLHQDLSAPRRAFQVGKRRDQGRRAGHPSPLPARRTVGADRTPRNDRRLSSSRRHRAGDAPSQQCPDLAHRSRRAALPGAPEHPWPPVAPGRPAPTPPTARETRGLPSPPWRRGAEPVGGSDRRRSHQRRAIRNVLWSNLWSTARRGGRVLFGIDAPRDLLSAIQSQNAWRGRMGVEPTGAGVAGARTVLKTGEATGPLPPPGAAHAGDGRV